MKRFVVASEGLDAHERTAEFADYLRGHKCTWWHWIKGVWLIVDFSEVMSSEDFRNKVADLTPGMSNLVLEIPSASGWHGYGFVSRQNPDKNMFDWIKTYWDPESQPPPPLLSGLPPLLPTKR